MTTNVYDFEKFSSSCFAEEIIYTPSNGSPITINAVVFRVDKSEIKAKSDVPILHYKYIVHINRTDVAQVTENEDTITMLDNNGETRTFRVQSILDSDPGRFKVGVN